MLCLLAALAVIEAPGFFLQVYAWGTMVRDRAPHLGFEAAVVESLSGTKPCSKCLALAREREKKREQAPIEEQRRGDPLIASHQPTCGPAFCFPRSGAARAPAPCLALASLSDEEVPTPPPQVG